MNQPGSTPEIRAPRILVIDDEIAILRLVQILFVRLNYEVTTAENAEAGLSLLRHTPFDCVITDAVMPEMTGYDLVKTIRLDPRYVQLPILMLTRKRNREDVKKAVEAGVTDYVLKPIDESLLIEKVEISIKKSGIKAPVRETPLTGRLGEAEIGVGCRIASLSESSMTVRLQYRLEREVPFQLRTRIFSDIGVETPSFKLDSCEMLPIDPDMTDASPEPTRYSWEARISFGGLPEESLVKIREWLKKKSSLGA